MDRDTQRLMMGATQLQAGQVEFTSAGTFSFVVPEFVTSISAVVCQPGQGAGPHRGGDGGKFRGKNGIPVVPRETLTVFVPPAGVGHARNDFTAGTVAAHVTIMRGSTVLLASNTAVGSGVFGGDGGVGSTYKTVTGDGSASNVVHGGSGGGAGGYAGKGGDAGHADATKNGVLGKAEDGAGGAGAGGSTHSGPALQGIAGWVQGWGGVNGGGTVLRGQGANGIGRPLNSTTNPGINGSEDGIGVAVGGGGRAGGTVYNTSGIGEQGLILLRGADGSPGGARLIWPGDVRQYPSTMTNDI